jgi:hypothetical protein
MFNAPRFNSEKVTKIVTLNEANTLVALPNGVRCVHFPSVITTIMDHKVQLIKPLILGELYAV